MDKIASQEFCTIATFTAGIRIIPSTHIPTGYRHIQGTDVFISSTDYETMRFMSVEGILLALAGLSKMESLKNEEEGEEGFTPVC